MKGTTDHGLRYTKSEINEKGILTAYADADWANDVDRKSTSGYLYKLYGNIICWATRKQSAVALSSTEAEFISLANCAAEYLWLKHFLNAFGTNIEQLPLKLYEDNQSCIASLTEWEHKRLKHVDIKYNFGKDLYKNGEIDVEYIDTENQTADILTKALSKNKFIWFRENMALSNY